MGREKYEMFPLPGERLWAQTATHFLEEESGLAPSSEGGGQVWWTGHLHTFQGVEERGREGGGGGGHTDKNALSVLQEAMHQSMLKIMQQWTGVAQQCVLLYKQLSLVIS